MDANRCYSGEASGRPPHKLVVLSTYQAIPLIEARERGERKVRGSLDLGLTSQEIELWPSGVNLPDRVLLPWAAVEAVADGGMACFLMGEGSPRKIYLFSEYFNRPYSLMATESAPTLINSGFTMHRIKGSDPHRDTLNKIRAVSPFVGKVLDSATGLGYTAIEAARTATEVVTVELDPAVLDVARMNPWSRDLFENRRITQLIGDVFEEIRSFPHASFSRVIHDPPTLSLAGELYSGEFYRQILRVLEPGGRAFHYVGNLGSRDGARVSKGASERLKEAGFARVERVPEAFGLVAVKSR